MDTGLTRVGRRATGEPPENTPDSPQGADFAPHLHPLRCAPSGSLTGRTSKRIPHERQPADPRPPPPRPEGPRPAGGRDRGDRPGRQGHRPPRAARAHRRRDRRGRRGERAGRGAAEARRALRPAPARVPARLPRGRGVRVGGAGRRDRAAHARGGRRVLRAGRSARRLLEHRRRGERGHDLQRAAPRPLRRGDRGVGGAGGPQAGGRRLHPLRLVGRARALDRPRRLDVHAGPAARRLRAREGRHSRAGDEQDLLAQRGLRERLRGRPQGATSTGRTARATARATSARWWPTCIARC